MTDTHKIKGSNVEIQGEYILIVRDEITNTTKGGILLTEDSAKKKDAKVPIGRIAAKGPDSKITQEVGQYVMYDPQQCRAVFRYKSDLYLLGFPTAILLQCDGPEGFESIQ